MLRCCCHKALLFLVVAIHHTASSPHDELQSVTTVQTAPQHYIDSASNGRTFARELFEGFPSSHATCEEVVAGASNAAIRIGFEIIDAENVGTSLLNLVEHHLMPRAVAFLSSALQVRRVAQPLRAFRVDLGWGPQAPTCGNSHPVTIPDKYLMPASPSDPFTLGPGVADEDFHIFVTIKDGAVCSREGMKAYAVWCVKDQCDRPIFALVNFCKSELSLAASDEDDQYYTTVHELTHAMVFTSSLFPYFRNSDGTPIITRSPFDADIIPSAVDWTCNIDGSWTFPDPTTHDLQYVDLPADMISIFSERGFISSECACPIGKSIMQRGCLVPSDSTSVRQPSCVMRLKMPTVLREVRDFFDCYIMEGAELENQDSTSCTIIASHWEQRVFNGELMSPYGTAMNPRYISRVTLALFQDSGWYDVDLSKADPLTVGIHWGYKQGCVFALEKCVDGGYTNFPRHYCTTLVDSFTCSLDRKSAMRCPQMTTYDFPSAQKQFKYFNANIIDMGSNLDHCPVPRSISNRVCTSAYSDTYPIQNVNYMRELFGPASRCFESTLHADVRGAGGRYRADQFDWKESHPVCYETECFDDGRKYVVKIAKLNPTTSKTESVSIIGICSSSGQALTYCDFIGSVTCAAPEEICFNRRAETIVLPVAMPSACDQEASIARSPYIKVCKAAVLLQIVSIVSFYK